MSATAAVAVIGAVATPVVAIAGYLFAGKQARGDRQAALSLARATHEHDGEIAAAQRQHEAALRMADRVYEDRKAAYLTALSFTLAARSRMDAQAAWVSGGREGNAPPAPFSAERGGEWDRIRVEVTAFGSRAVDEAMAALVREANDFIGATNRARTAGDPLPDDLRDELEKARKATSTAYNTLRICINADLASP
jgi:hypothetical protein